MDTNYILSVEVKAQIDAAIAEGYQLYEVTPTKRGPRLFRCVQKEITFTDRDELYRKIEAAMKREERVQIRKTSSGVRFFRIRREEVK